MTCETITPSIPLRFKPLFSRLSSPLLLNLIPPISLLRHSKPTFPLIPIVPLAMKPSTHSFSPDPYHKFLKPGALARLRDSKITAKSHRHFIVPLSISDPSTSDSVGQQTALTVGDEFPFYPGRLFGPRCLKRKKFVANKSVLFVSRSNDEVSETVVT